MYSRQSPSERYKTLIEQYKQLHIEGEKHLGVPPEKTFPGFSILPHVDRIKRLITETDSNFLLDYGCGKGNQYVRPIIDMEVGEPEMLVDFWDISGVHRYDPCYEPFSELPEYTFDGVISTDMLEHCPEEDIPWILDEIFSFAEKFVYANVACYPAMKTLPNGENAHCTIQPPEWWRDLFQQVAGDHPGLRWEIVLSSPGKTAEGQPCVKQITISNSP